MTQPPQLCDLTDDCEELCRFVQQYGYIHKADLLLLRQVREVGHGCLEQVKIADSVAVYIEKARQGIKLT